MRTMIALLFAGASFGQSTFPIIATNGLTYTNSNTLNSNAFSYQQADFDPARNQVLFYPYGSITSTPVANSGVLLVYKPVPGGFANPANWVEVDLTNPSVGVSPDAFNFGGGFTDGSGPTTSIAFENPSFAYMPPGPRNAIAGGPSRAEQGNITVQVNLANLATDPQNVNGATYKFIDLSTVPSIPAIGGFAGVWAAGSAYYCPTGNDKNGNANTVLIRYNSALGAFDDPAAWESFDMSTIPVAQSTGPADPQLGGMQSAAYIAPNVYLIPFINGSEASTGTLTTASKIVAYNTAGSFTSGAAYGTFDLSTLSSLDSTLFAGGVSSKFRGYTGGVIVNGGTKLILVPWGDRNLQTSNSIAVEYDSTMPMNNPSAWTYFDLATINPQAAGYQYGWLDKDGFVWFVPTHDYQAVSIPAIPTFVVYNTALPFNQPSSWTSYPNKGYPTGTGVWLTGAAYDPNTNTAWLASYGVPPTSTPVEIAYNVELQEQGTSTASVATGGFVNAASYTAPVAPGSLASGFGNFLLGYSQGATSFPIAPTLTGLSLSFTGGYLAPMLFVAPNQANFQVPWELAGQTQSTVTTSLIGENGSTQTASLATYAPGIFTTNASGSGQGEIFNLSFALADSSNPAAPGNYVVIYCTGLGPVMNQPATGAPGPSSPLANTPTSPTVTIGGVTSTVQYSGLAPGYVGLYQVNALVPPGAPAGSAVPVTIAIGGVTSNTVTMAVQ